MKSNNSPRRCQLSQLSLRTTYLKTNNVWSNEQDQTSAAHSSPPSQLEASGSGLY